MSLFHISRRTPHVFFIPHERSSLLSKSPVVSSNHSLLFPPASRFTCYASQVHWSGRWDLNPRQPAWKAGTLPLSYARLFLIPFTHTLIKPTILRRASGSLTYKLAGTNDSSVGGQARIRTLEDISQQIYSLPPLAAWVPARDVSLFYANQIAVQPEDVLADLPLNKDKDLPVHSFLSSISKIDSLKCSDRLVTKCWILLMNFCHVKRGIRLPVIFFTLSPLESNRQLPWMTQMKPRAV